MEKRRIFIAIQISQELKNIAEVYLKPFLADGNLRIPKKNGWHITVVFCGYLNNEETEKLKEIVNNAALKFKPFELAPQKILFAPPRQPRMIWLNFRNSPQFAELKNNIENAMLACQKKGLFENFREEMRKPNPHLTLARFEEYYFNNVKNLLPENGINLTNEAAPFLVKNIDIMESHLSRAGADYELLNKISLL